MKTQFAPDANTQVILVKEFKQGESLALPDTPAVPTPPTAAADLCLVKMVVGPGNPGTAGAPSTAAGIGIEVWLPTPANWNQRIRNMGGGGWAGGQHGSATRIASAGNANVASQGWVVGATDTGHTVGSGAFAMKEDGSINTALWQDFSERSLRELALKTRALVQGYYGKPQDYAYWQGCSTGGRQGYKIAQEHPDLYDGYLNGAPAFNWTRFITNELYPQVVMRRDLGGPMGNAKLGFVSGAAVAACNTVGGQQLAFILDPGQCRYDPTRDANVLCNGVVGNGVTGASANASCVNLAEAQAINKMWYGQTADGTAPDPALDNASTPVLTNNNHLWWGLTRGTSLTGLAGTNPFGVASDMVALELENPTLATPSFINATGNGANGWQSLTYADLAFAYQRGVELQPFFGNINTDNPDLRKLRDSGGKVISYHGLADTLITPAGSANYFTRVANLVGGYSEVNKFNKLYMVPGMGHCAGVGSVSPTGGPAANATSVPLPSSNLFFDALVNWVENGTAPGQLQVQSSDASVSLPLCPYPQKITYSGAGSPASAASYTCR